MISLLFLQLLTVAGETGATGAHVVSPVGLVLVSGAGNAIIHPPVPAENNVQAFLCRASLVMKDRVLVRKVICLECHSKFTMYSYINELRTQSVNSLSKEVPDWIKFKEIRTLLFISLLAVDGGWGDWSDWSACSESCGPGTSIRSRQCNNPPPSSGGKQCTGLPVSNKPCNEGSCPGTYRGGVMLFVKSVVMVIEELEIVLLQS